MRALLSRSAGGPATLELTEVRHPTPAAGQVIIAVHACAINFPDVLIIEDRYQYKPARPFSPGGEIAGVIESVGSNVEGWSVGDRVIAMTLYGGLAEKVAVDAAALYRLPDDRTFTDGAALLLTYGTAIHALVDRGKVKRGQDLLILGAAGGVGLAAIELGKAFGARVVAAVSSEEKAAAARLAGADECLLYGRAPFDKAQSKSLAEQFKAAAGGGGFDIIFDPVGGDYAEPALRSIGWEGRYLVVGFPAGIFRLPLNLVLLKSCDVCGVFWGAFVERFPAMTRSHVEQLFQLWSGGKIAPQVTGLYPLERAGEAITAMGSRQAIGKLVVTVV